MTSRADSAAGLPADGSAEPAAGRRAPGHRGTRDALPRCRRRARWATAACIALVALLGGGGAGAQQNGSSAIAESPEVALFRLIGIDGWVRGRYWRTGNENVTGAGGVPGVDTITTKQTLSNLSGDVFVMTHSYVYHPNLLLLDLGAGPVFFRTGYADDGSQTNSNTSTYNLTARATILRDKPYRGGLFYERVADAEPVGPAQALLTENTRYGFDFALLPPVTPVSLFLDANRFVSQGKGTDQVLDERVDEANLRLERKLGKLGETTFHYQGIRDESQSGSLGLPIQATTSRTNRADLETRLNLGAKTEYTLVNSISWNAQDYTTNDGPISESNSLRFDLNVNGRNSDVLQTHARVRYDGIEQSTSSGNFTARIGTLDGGVVYQVSPEFSTTFDVNAIVNRNSAFTANEWGTRGSLQYQRELPLGFVAANYAFVYFKRDQQDSMPVVPVVGERVILSGVRWVSLRFPQVVPGSVVVSNVPRTQTYVEGLDYALQVIGLTTQIQRLLGGNITDGQEVLVDYEYESGGTFVLAELDNSVTLEWRYKSLFGVYLRYFDSAPRLLSGSMTAPLNPTRDTIAGTRADVPFTAFQADFMIGGLAEWENRQEVISPYKRSTFDVYAELPLPQVARGGIRLSARQQKTEYDLTPDQDVNHRTYTVRLWSRIRNGPTLTLEASRNRDTGSPSVASEYNMVTARAQWRVRRVLMTLEFARTQTTQGTTQSTQSRGQFLLRRDF